MPAYNYDYSSLLNGQKWHTPTRTRLWQGGLTLLLIVTLVATWRGLLHDQVKAYNALDDFQQLNNMSAVAFEPATFYNREEHAVVTSLYSDSSVSAVMTLGYSLKSANVSARMILMYHPDRVSARSLCLVSSVGWTPHNVPLIPPPHNGKGLREHFKDQYTKLNLWNLDSIGVKRAVYLDNDILVRKNFDELFTLPFNFAAVPDVFDDQRGFSVGFNAGVLFLRPSTAIFEDMLSKLKTADYPSRFAEEAFLNLYFGAQVIRLPYAYNANLAIKQRSAKLWEAMRVDIRMIHYANEKPFPLQQLELLHLRVFFEGRKRLHHGLWADEMGWWANSWNEMLQSRRDILAQCEN